ncbi:unnamed protein product [Acidithrix sp. C25]|nr:unnamed protein product [Acidithrix sp. C25]
MWETHGSKVRSKEAEDAPSYFQDGSQIRSKTGGYGPENLDARLVIAPVFLFNLTAVVCKF